MCAETSLCARFFAISSYADPKQNEQSAIPGLPVCVGWRERGIKQLHKHCGSVTHYHLCIISHIYLIHTSFMHHGVQESP